MPRMLRLEAPGSLLHAMARGIDGKAIFLDDNDCCQFLERFSKHRAACGYKCLAWCLMPNHYHFLLRSSEKPPSSLMRPLNSGYARWYNKKYGRQGYLFQDRFKSVLCQDQVYANELIRYIHLNPVRAGLTPSLENLKFWPWVGHGYLIGHQGALGEEFQDRNEALRRFGLTPGLALVGYLRFLKDGINSEDITQSGILRPTESMEIGGSFKGWPAVVGDVEFARAAMERHQVSRWRKHRKADYQNVLDDLAEKVCKECGIELKLLFRRGKGDVRSAARALFCYKAHVLQMIPFAQIARYLGTTISPVVRLTLRAESMLCRDGKRAKR